MQWAQGFQAHKFTGITASTFIMYNQTSLDEAWAPGTAASTAFATATNVYFWQ